MTKMKTLLILIHMLYSHECCDDHHCRPVPCNEVIDLGDDGWRWRDRTFPRWTLRASPHGNCHVCVANMPVCIYLTSRAQAGFMLILRAGLSSLTRFSIGRI